MATTQVSITIPDDLLEAINTMRGEVSLSRYLSNLAAKAAMEAGLSVSSVPKEIIPESMFE